MSSSFSFGFEDEDDELPTASDNASGAMSANNAVDLSPMNEVKIHTLEALLIGLPSSIHYVQKASLLCNGDSFGIPQRDFHDIKAQLMAEDDGLQAIPGISSQDLEPGIYEGGFKTWECAEDLSQYLSQNDWASSRTDRIVVLELGAGTALPSCSILQSHLMDAKQTPRDLSLKIILADYNSSVLEVATIPNLLLTWASSSGMLTDADTLEVTRDVKDTFTKSILAHRTSIDAISGAWSSQFVETFLSLSDINGDEQVLILASETIYSPSSVIQFTRTLMAILKAIKGEGSQPIALIATKRIYFGVGGGLDDFIAQVRELGGQSHIVWQTKGEGVGRAIASVSIAGS